LVISLAQVCPVPTSEASGAISAHVTSTALAASLRAICVHVEGIRDDEPAWGMLQSRIDKFVGLFLDKHWLPPRRYSVIQPLSYVLFQGPVDATFTADSEAIRAGLERHLFGDGGIGGVDVSCLIGSPHDVEIAAAMDHVEFLATHAAAEPAPGAETFDDASPGAPAARAKLMDPNALLWARFRLYAGYYAPKSAMLSYVATLSTGGAEAAAVPFEDVVATTGVKVAEFEAAALRFAATKVAQRTQQGAVSYCLVPLSYETLTDRRGRQSYLALAARYPEQLRRHIVPSVFAGPDGPSSSSLMEIIGAVRREFELVDWRTRSCSIPLDALKHAGVFAVTLAPPRAKASRRLELARLPDFVRKLKTLRIRPGVAGLTERSEIAAAISAGAQHLSGPAVSGPMSSLLPRAPVDPKALPVEESDFP
jgi:hypothetical protein